MGIGLSSDPKNRDMIFIGKNIADVARVTFA